MGVSTKRASGRRQAIRVGTVETPGCEVTNVQIGGGVEVASREGWLCFWVAGREVRIGPLTADQAEKLCEDLGYDAVA